MLEALRKGAATWVAKIFIALLVMSFAVWGVADMFGGYGRRTVATVGDTEISYDEFQEALRRQMQALRGQLGRSLTLEEARNFGIDQLVLRTLITEAALENQGNLMNLGISNNAIAARIMREPAFRDATGRFSRTIFEQILSANGLSEGAYVARQRDTYIRAQLIETIGGSVQLPKVFVRAADRYRNETRRLKYFTLGMDKIEPVGEPTAEELQKYYDGNKASYAVPELRKIGVLALLPEDVAKTVSISEEDLKAYYDSRTAQFRTPEKRTLQQIPFDNEEAAEAASEKIKGGASFEDIAKERGLSEQDINLGTVTKKDLVDKAIAKAAFALGDGEVSEPVKGQLTTVLLKATNIQPEKITPFEEAKSEIRETLGRQRAADVILDFYNKIEDERASGAGLAEIAKTFDLNYVTVDGIDRNGKGPDGKPLSVLPVQKQVLSEAFQSEPGVENEPIETPDHGLVWYEIIEVIPTRVQPLADVRDKAVADWRAAEERARLAKMARGLAERGRKGERLEDLAEEQQVEVKESEPVKREAESEALPRAAIAQAFALSRGGFGSAAAEDGRKRVVFQVASIEPPAPPDQEEPKKLEESFEPQIADDLVAQYVDGLTQTFGVTRNQQVIDVVTGRTDSQGLR